MKKSLAFALLSLSLAGPILAAGPTVSVETGQELLAKYRSGFLKAQEKVRGAAVEVDWIDDGYFIGYVDGVFESNQASYCLSSGGQLHEIVGNYLERHPEKLGRPAAELVKAALKEAFPCPTAKRK